eukprot:TRINITY_DN2075_c0_g1_i1.p1 TRINITY_DN2075_c0_g1~~TRINITY_DN2075_c0_g1_i1.p1  ORF type:complete len:195 (-),score=27.42 TRINITY_DN2075_c0_g1_i1:97-600(-)
MAENGDPLMEGVFVLTPQSESSWGFVANAVIKLIESVISVYEAISPAHVYLTGISMGGGGTWEIASRFPEKFAAIAPMCGFSNSKWGSPLKNTPVYCAHGANDSVVPVHHSDDMVALLGEYENPSVVYKRLTNAAAPAKSTMTGHDPWSVTYADPDFWKWLFSFRQH